MIGAGDVARAACAGAHPGRGLDHGADHLGVLAHAEIVVGAPNHDLARTLRPVPDRVREAAGDPFQLGEHPVAPFVMQPAKGVSEEIVIIHEQQAFGGAGAVSGRNRFLKGFHAVCRGGH
jgi:hypothetical protein